MQHKVKDRFYNYIKHAENEVYWTEEEKLYLQTYKEYYKNCRNQITIFSKINNNKIKLVNESITPLECQIIGKYLQWSK